MHILKTSFHGNPNVGLYGICTPKYVILGHEVPSESDKDLAEIFGREVRRINAAGTPFVGVFLAGNSHGLIAPDILFEHEIEALKKLCSLTLLHTRHTCLGNNILVNDRIAYIHHEFSDDEEATISKALGVPTKRVVLHEIETPGSLAALNDKGMIVHFEVSAEDLAMMQEDFGVPAEHGSVNLGSPYVKGGILCNENGVLVGDQTGGPELMHIDRVLGFTQ
ncbi:MAG: translation initiation factor IF-6 [Nanoarchaeota archaeon]